MEDLQGLGLSTILLQRICYRNKATIEDRLLLEFEWDINATEDRLLNKYTWYITILLLVLKYLE